MLLLVLLVLMRQALVANKQVTVGISFQSPFASAIGLMYLRVKE